MTFGQSLVNWFGASFKLMQHWELYLILFTLGLIGIIIYWLASFRFM